MCRLGGIISYAPLEGERLKKAAALSRRLLLAMEHGGMDATGVSVHGRTVNAHFKLGVRAKQFVNLKECNATLSTPRTNIIMLHTRAGTHGEATDNRNNHPFVDETISLMHNGVISNASAVQSKHGLACAGVCDSEVALRIIQKLGLRKGVAELEGSAALTITSWKDGLKVTLFKGDGSPLVIAYDEANDWFVYASTYDIIIASLPDVVVRGVQMSQSLPFVELDVGEAYTFDMREKKAKVRKGLSMKQTTFVWKGWKKDEKKREPTVKAPTGDAWDEWNYDDINGIGFGTKSEE